MRISLNSCVDTCFHFPVKPFIGLRLKRWSKGSHLINNASNGPNITLWTIGLIVPYLRTGIIRCTSLCFCELLFFQQPRNVHITEFTDTTAKEYVSSFDIPMKNFVFMEKLRSTKQILCYLPNLLFCELTTFFGMCIDFFLNFFFLYL
jgi:hypothetical protein